MAGLFLGGSLAPAGTSLNFLRSKLDETIDVLAAELRAELGFA